MEWMVEYTDEFGGWWDTLTEPEQIDVAAYVEALRAADPICPFPIRAGSMVHGIRI